MGSLLSKLLGFLFKKSTSKFILFSALYFTVSVFFPELVVWLGINEFLRYLSGALGSLPSSVGYFLAPFNLGMGLKVVISAYITRFAIRRIPIIG